MPEETNSSDPSATEASSSATEASTAEAPAPDAPAETETPAGETDFQYDITIEAAGPTSKKISVVIPQSRIAEKLEEQFKDLRRSAAIPGFRAGHAPRKLVEKRFASDVREQVRRQLIGESYRQALEKNSLSVIGEPEFEDADKIKLPDEGDLKYNFSVEVQPDITLPSLQGIKVKKPKVEVTPDHIDQAMANLRRQNGGALLPVEDRGVEAGDYLTADIHLRQDGKLVAHQHDVQFVAQKETLCGVPIDDVAEKLAGAKPGETRSFNVTVPETHPAEALRGKEAEISIAIKDIRRLELPEVDKAFLDSLGFNDVGELREALRERLAERIAYDVQQAMRDQVGTYLLDNTQVEIPPKLSERQSTRLAGRRAVELMMRGMSREQVMANIPQLKSSAQPGSDRELKLFFILQKMAGEWKIEVEEAELNSHVAMLAARQGKRPEKVKHEMAQDGSLTHLYIRLREEQALDKALESAEIEEVDPATFAADQKAAPKAS